jgi:O-antigen/teichoic acid export membrane protein
MIPRLVWRRRSATAVGIYASAAFGILGTIVAARVLGVEGFGVYAVALATAGFFQALLDLTVEESLTKYGFRYVTTEDWGRLRRLFRKALQLKLLGGLVASLVLVALAPVADALFDTEGLLAPMLAVAALPLVQAPENVASTALLLRGRYDVRGWLQALSMGLRLAAIAVGTQFGVTEAMLGLVAAQVVATAVTGWVGWEAFRRFPSAPERSLGEDRADVRTFVAYSSVATGMISLRTTLAPLLLGIVSNTTQVGLLRVAQAPQTGLTSLSSPVRLILLTEQTRDWERGDRHGVLRGVRMYTAAGTVLMVIAVPLFILLMPWLVRVVFGTDYTDAVAAARIALVAAAIQFAYGWTKSFPVSIGRPNLRILTHGVETAVLLPLTALFGAAWGVTGAALAMLFSTVVFVALWTVLLIRIHGATPRPSPPAEGALAP